MIFYYQSAKGDPGFKCDDCGDRDKEIRNCGNKIGLIETIFEGKTAPDLELRQIKKTGVSKVWKLGPVRLYECPLSWIKQQTHTIIDTLFSVADSPALLFDGGWMRQPNWFVEAWKIFKDVQHDQMKRQNGRK